MTKYYNNCENIVEVVSSMNKQKIRYIYVRQQEKNKIRI